MSKQNDLRPFLLALVVTVALLAGVVYFVRHIWQDLPPWLSLIVYILVAVAVIGYPIYSLARWSDRAFSRLSQGETKRGEGKRRHEDSP